jgi:hypothetical protein
MSEYPGDSGGQESERLRMISYCMDQLASIRLVRNEDTYPFGKLLGEMDWLAELRRLLYETH